MEGFNPTKKALKPQMTFFVQIQNTSLHSPIMMVLFDKIIRTPLRQILKHYQLQKKKLYGKRVKMNKTRYKNTFNKFEIDCCNRFSFLEEPYIPICCHINETVEKYEFNRERYNY